jgi:ABC-type branched-subunit amino acid transport system ATPase component
MSGIALAAQSLSKRFGALRVTDAFSFELPVGARHALIGPNGAGKTTLINLLTGVLAPDAGTIALDGEDITALRVDERARRGLVRTFQINALFPELTVLESVTLAVCERLGIAGDWRRKVASCGDAVEEALGVIATLGLTDQCRRLTRELAYGRQRLLEIALALAARPKVLLLDEPAAGVPRAETTAIFAAVSALPRDIAVLFIEHDMDVVFRFASRILVMVSGRLLTAGSPAEIAADERVREVYLGRRRHAG